VSPGPAPNCQSTLSHYDALVVHSRRRGVKVAFGDQLVRVYGNTAINTGYYTFSYVKDGETRRIPARYSFTYVKNGERWLIVDHHSSAMPSPSN
jgi:hypothetical protein